MKKKILQFLEGIETITNPEKYGVYPKSVKHGDDGVAFMVRGEEQDKLVAQKALGFSGEEIIVAGKEWTIADLTHENGEVLRRQFPFTAPISVLRKQRSVGTGDRLGIATPGHIRAFENYDAYPVLAQQSIRELTLTGRTFEHVLDCASFNVFREGFTRGFGADGDHLKTPKEVEYALSCGYTMITLDCSEHIRNDIVSMSYEDVMKEYIPDAALEEKYIGKIFEVEGRRIQFEEEDFRRMCLIYKKAIDFAASIYHRYFADKADDLDFEVSIDETMTPTTPAQHFFVAKELTEKGVKMATVAPRFCGEFQKGIDYIGDLAQFEAEFADHAAIAKYFGYKISVHSGSDKFSVFEIVGKYTNGNFHLKTAGTSWLEAMSVIASHEPGLYREIHQYALEYAFKEASKYYHVTTNLDNIPALDTLTDEQLPSLFENNDSRQLIHITYGLILTEKNADGSSRFRDRLYQAWRTYDEEYAQYLKRHIGRHLELLYKGFNK